VEVGHAEVESGHAEGRCAVTEPHPDDVMREAFKGAGFNPDVTTPANLWRLLLPEIERMEASSTLANGRIDEAAISNTVKAVVEGILARRRYAAAMKAAAKKKVKRAAAVTKAAEKREWS